MVGNLAIFSSLAIMPEQLADYVRAVSSLQSREIDGCLLHYNGSSGVLAGYTQNIHENPSKFAPRLENVIESAIKKCDLQQLTVLAPILPERLPPHAAIRKDAYWFLDAPSCLPPQKVRNLVKRAKREIAIEHGNGANAWTSGHARLVEQLCLRKNGRFEPGTLHIFDNLKNYLGLCPETRLYSARPLSGKLAGCALADFTALETAFYMFAFRAKDAPPGTADALLFEIVGEARARGYKNINLGLGIDEGVEFFKKKWGAKPLLPYNEIFWRIERPKKGWSAKFFWKKS